METKIEKLFSLLDDWRKLPAYQLERRADIFFALYLPEILNQPPFEFGITHDNIIPEFPVRTNKMFNGKPTFRSNKIDYVVVSKKKKAVYLIELKTDENSRRDEQDRYLEDAEKETIKKLLKDISEISKKSKSKEKYEKLDECLEKSGIKESDLSNSNPKIVYILPNKEIENPNDISFDDIIKILEGKNDGVSEYFIDSLKNWQND